MTRSHGSRARRRWPRRVAGLVVALMLGVAFGLVLNQSWQQATSEQQDLAVKRQGLSYLDAGVRLVGALALAQAGTSASAPVDLAPLRATVDAVAAQDQANGASLGTRRRWADLRSRIDDLLKAPGNGRLAYDRFAEVSPLAVDLIDTVIASSGLARDSDRLVDAVARRLPEVMANAGSAAGTAALGSAAGSSSAAGSGAAAGTVAPGSASGSAAVSLAVARDRVAVAAAQIEADLAADQSAKSTVDGFPVGGSIVDGSTVDAALIAGQDAFQAAADAFAPPSTIQARLPEAGDAGVVAGAAAPLLEAGAALATAAIGVLDARAAARQDAVADRRLFLLGAGSAGIVGAIVLLCLLAPGRRPAGDEGDEESGEPAVAAADPAALMDARDMLLEELVHVGRGVRSPARRDADDVQ